MKKIVQFICFVCLSQNVLIAQNVCNPTNLIIGITTKCANRGQCDGHLSVKITNNNVTPPSTYTWNAAQFPQFACLKSGDYRYTVTDPNSCTFSNTTTIPECGITAINDLEDWVKVSPNPTTENVIIDVQNVVIQGITLIDIFGKTIQKYKSGTILGPLSISTSGTYFLRIETDKGVVMKKVVRL